MTIADALFLLGPLNLSGNDRDSKAMLILRNRMTGMRDSMLIAPDSELTGMVATAVENFVNKAHRKALDLPAEPRRRGLTNDDGSP